MTMPTKFKAAMLTVRPVTEFIKQVRCSNTKIKNNSDLPNPPVPIPIAEQHVDDLDDATQAAHKGPVGSASIRDTKMAIVLSDQRQNMAYVEAVANSNPEKGKAIVEGAGYELVTHTVVAKEQFAAKHAKTPNAVNLEAKAEKGRVSYYWQMCANATGPNPGPYTDLAETHVCKFTATGLTAGQTYAFRYHVNAVMKPIHTLAEAIAEQPRLGLSMLDDDTLDPKVREGFRELERRLSDETLVKDLQDYRQFFDFDLHMTNDRGQVTTLSKRSVTGSGGQKQAPYYVAVGAAMAAAYYPKTGHGDPEGLGLVVFDEAFNNLDAPNTQALLSFFSDLHLQVIVAAPDKVRAMFLETVDTIVSVNRRPDTQEPVLTMTYPKMEARQALIDANPAHRGIEAYRPLSRAAAE